MKQVAKLVIIDNTDRYLLLYRDAHPVFGNDPDLPGGTLEGDEQPLDTAIRETLEEAGITVDGEKVLKIYEGTNYSAHRTCYLLYTVRMDHRPAITLSWEHSSYEWLDRKTFLKKSKHANDTYMHMVYDVLS